GPHGPRDWCLFGGP
nr:Chain C, Apt48 peptide [synthetic construct]6TBT_D Chain D, Apt48 peptide [synthetic construct]